MNPKVDFFFNKASKWQKEYRILRTIVMDCGLTEELKWGVPCYTFKNNNILLIHGFKEYCALLFHKGALLEDAAHILIQQTANVQAARQIRFTTTAEINALKSNIKAYIFEAIEVEKMGLVVKMKKTAEFNLPEELQIKFKETPNLETAFKALTPGRQRGYLLYFSQAKQSKTRALRIEKSIQKIVERKGLNDT